MEQFIDDATSCAIEGCKRLPVRMIYEAAEEVMGMPVIEITMLCIEHAQVYAPTGKVISDIQLPTADLPRDVLEADSH